MNNGNLMILKIYCLSVNIGGREGEGKLAKCYCILGILI